MTFSISTFIISSSLLVKQLYLYLKQDSWIGVILGCFLSLPVIWIYHMLVKKFPKKGLIELNDIVFGRILGKVISGLYIFFFLSLSFLNLRVLGDFVKDVILPKTPMAIIMLIFLVICAWALRKGICNLTRCGFLFTIISFAALLINSMLLSKDIRMEHFLPMFRMPVSHYAIGAHWVAMLPLCEIFAFYMLAPFMRKPQEFGKSMKNGLTLERLYCCLLR